MVHGLIAYDTFRNRGNSHYADLDGNIACGSKNRFGFDCDIEVKIETMEVYFTDEYKRLGPNLKFVKGHLPLNTQITCKKCLSKIEKLLHHENNR